MKVLRIGPALAVAALLAAALSGTARTAGGSCTLVPTLRDVTVTQGLNSYARLVRGKETLVRLYLSLPSCASTGNAIEVDAASLAVKNSGTGVSLTGSPFASTPTLASPLPQITNTTTLVNMAPSDPVFVVPGAALASGTTGASYTASFSATITYRTSTTGAPGSFGTQSSVTFSTLPGTRTAITKTIEAKTNALRILVVPMGRPLEAEQTVSVSGSPTGGSFTLNFGGQPTGPINYNASAADVSAAIGQLSNVGTSNVSVTGGPGPNAPWTVSFTGAAGAAPSVMTVGTNSLSGGTSPSVNISTGAAILGNALTSFSRQLPVPDGTPGGARLGDLTGTSGGVRYAINAGALNLSGLLDTNGLFCGNGTNFSTIKTGLAQALQSWNAANTSAPADRVIGVVLQSGSETTSTTNAACAEGMASVNSPQAWVRLDKYAGPVFSMETAHTFGLVPPNRWDGTYHSIYVSADNAAGDLNRVFNVTNRALLPTGGNFTAMDFSTSWTNDNTVYENQDYADLLCAFGGATTTECTTSNTAGTPVGVAAAPVPTIEFTGFTDDTQLGTTLYEAFAAQSTPITAVDPSSPYHVVEKDGSGVTLRDISIDISPLDSGHTSTGGDVQLQPLPHLVSFAVPDANGTAEFDFMKGTTLLFQSKDDGQAPTITTATAVSPNNLPQVGATGTVSVSATAHAPAPTTPPKPDVVFLSDTTGSMGPAISNVQTNAESIMASVQKAQSDAQFAVANYKDFNGGVCTASAYAYKLDQALTSDTTAATNAIKTWSASGGCDTPEAQLFALHEIAANLTFGSGSTPIVVWFGDNPGHDPICAAIAQTQDANVSADITKSSVIAELTAKGIKVFPISVTSGATSHGLNYDPSGLDNDYADCTTASSPNQGTDIASATGGMYQENVTASAVSDAILRALGLLVTIAPQQKSCDAGLSIAFTPTSKDAQSDTDVSFPGTVTTSGASPGVHSCVVTFTVDGKPLLDSGGNPITQTISVDVTGLTGPHELVTFQASDNTNSNPVIGDVFLKCGGVYNVVATGLRPASNGTFYFDTASGCPSGQSGQFYVTASDAFERSSLVLAGNVAPAITPLRPPPDVAITSPLDGASFTQFDDVPLNGSAKDLVDGQLSGSSLQWFCDGASVGSGGSLDLQPGSACLAVGTHVVTLSATNSNSQTSSASVSISVQADADHDGMSITQETAVNACRPGGSEANPDSDPANATADYDGDGIANRDDPQPCTPATSYRAVSLFAPSTISLSSTASTASFQGILLSLRDLSTVDPSSVAITNIAGTDLTGNPAFANTNWVVVNQVGAAKFNLQNIIAFLKSKGIVNRTVAITMTGRGPGWSFTAVASAVVTP